MTDASSPTRFGGQRGFAPAELTIALVVISVLGAIVLPRCAHSQLRIGKAQPDLGSVASVVAVFPTYYGYGDIPQSPKTWIGLVGQPSTGEEA